MPLFDPKAKTIAGYQKKIDDDRNAIKNHYYAIGKLYYDQYKDMSLDVTTEINSRCDNVTELYNDIKSCELKILYEKGLKVCKNCGKENNLEYAFCFACGSRFDENDRKTITDIPESNNVPADSDAATDSNSEAESDKEIEIEAVEESVQTEDNDESAPDNTVQTDENEETEKE
ncbi:MAG: zinc ribbon domain-containing protein [Clostridia bacterium]|nr:zinc ribbon domain-containing protein [Clostridia bacterium]